MPGAKDGLTLTSSGQYKDHKQTKIQFAETMRVREFSTVLPNLVKKQTIEPGFYTIRFPLTSRLTAGPLVEGEEMTVPSQFSTYSRELTTKEWGILAFRSDRVQRQTATHNIDDELPQRMGEAMARLEEQEIIELFQSLSTKFDVSGNTYLTANGSVTTESAANSGVRPKGVNPKTLAFGALEAKRDRVADLGPAPMGSKPFAILSPNAAFMIVENVMSTAGFSTTDGIGGPSTGGGGSMWDAGSVAIPQGMTAELVRNYKIGETGGVEVYQTPNIRIFDNTAGTAIASYNTKTGAKLSSATATDRYKTVSNKNSASQGAILIPECIYQIRERAFRTARETSERMRGDWFVATQEFNPAVMHDAWGIFLFCQAPTANALLPTNFDFTKPVGYD